MFQQPSQQALHSCTVAPCLLNCAYL